MLGEAELGLLRSRLLVLKCRVCFRRVNHLQPSVLIVVDGSPGPHCAGDRLGLVLLRPPFPRVLEMFCALCSVVSQRRSHIRLGDHQRAVVDLLPAHGTVTIVHSLALHKLGRYLVRPCLERLMLGLLRRRGPQGNVMVVLSS